MINQAPPESWQDLEVQVSRILHESGLTTEGKQRIKTARGRVEVDVLVRDGSTNPPSTILCECKHWQAAVSQSIVHAFRTVVDDYGANWGWIISSGGFQSGAREAAAHSNILLLTWSDFEELFVDRWIRRQIGQVLRDDLDELIDFTEPINSRVVKLVGRLDATARARFAELHKVHADLGYLAVVASVRPQFLENGDGLPLRGAVDLAGTNLPAGILDATSLREFASQLKSHGEQALGEFRALFPPPIE